MLYIVFNNLRMNIKLMIGNVFMILLISFYSISTIQFDARFYTSILHFIAPNVLFSLIKINNFIRNINLVQKI